MLKEVIKEMQQQNLDLEGPINLWDFVRKARWTDDHDYKRIEKLLLSMPKNTALAIHRDYKDKLDKLTKAIDNVQGVSDDGFSDLTNHIMGMGRKAYERAMGKDGVKFAQQLVNQNKYQENFGYSFHGVLGY